MPIQCNDRIDAETVVGFHCGQGQIESLTLCAALHPYDRLHAGEPRSLDNSRHRPVLSQKQPHPL